MAPKLFAWAIHRFRLLSSRKRSRPGNYTGICLGNCSCGRSLKQISMQQKKNKKNKKTKSSFDIFISIIPSKHSYIRNSLFLAYHSTLRKFSSIFQTIDLGAWCRAIVKLFHSLMYEFENSQNIPLFNACAMLIEYFVNISVASRLFNVYRTTAWPEILVTPYQQVMRTIE